MSLPQAGKGALAFIFITLLVDCDRLRHHPAGAAAPDHAPHRRRHRPRGRLRRRARLRVRADAVLLRAGARQSQRRVRAAPGAAVRARGARLRLLHPGIRADDRLAVLRAHDRRHGRGLLHARLRLRGRHHRAGQAGAELWPDGRSVRPGLHRRSGHRRVAGEPRAARAVLRRRRHRTHQYARSATSRCRSPCRWPTPARFPLDARQPARAR